MALHVGAAVNLFDSDSENELELERREDFRINTVSDLALYRSTRLTRPTFLFIKGLIGNNLARRTKRSKAVSVDLQIYLTLQFLASGGFQWLVGNTVKISQASASRIIRNVVDCIAERSGQFITFPPREEHVTIKQQFYEIGQGSRFRRGFPNVIGVIDCTHVRLQKPSENPEQYVDRYFQHSINVQLVCGPDLKIFNVLAAYPGGNHDSYIWRNSALRTAFLEGNFPDGWLIGDSGYPQENWLMTPVSNPRTPGEQLYNDVHIATRNPIERCNGALKSRFRCLAMTGGALAYNPQRVCAITTACCVLHNICLEQGEAMDIDNDIQQLINQDRAREIQYRGDVENDDVRNNLIRRRFSQ